MHFMWLDAHLASHYDRARRSMGTHRAALDFASAIIKDMGGEVPPENASEKELVLRRRKALNGRKVPRRNLANANGSGIVEQQRTRAEKLREWLKRRRRGRVLSTYKWPLIMSVALGAVFAIAKVLHL
jgi:hypothetical protein